MRKNHSLTNISINKKQFVGALAISLAGLLHAQVWNMDNTILKGKWEQSWDAWNASNHIYAVGGQQNSISYSSDDDYASYRLSGFINYTGGDMNISAPHANFELGGWNGNSFTSFNKNTTHINLKGNSILVKNFLELNNRVGSGVGRNPYKTEMTLDAGTIYSDNNGRITLYNGATLNLKSPKAVELNGEVFMGALQFPLAYEVQSATALNASGVTNDLYIRHLRIGQQNPARATITGSQKNNTIGNLDIWQDARLNYKGGNLTINRVNTNTDAAIRKMFAYLVTDTNQLTLGEVNLNNYAGGRGIVVNNTGNIVVKNALKVSGDIGGGWVRAGSPANFLFVSKGNVTFESNIALGQYVHLSVVANKLDAKDIDISKARYGATAPSLNFSQVKTINVGKVTGGSSNIIASNFNFKEFEQVVGNGTTINGYYTNFAGNIGTSHIGTVRFQEGQGPWQAGVRFEKGNKLTIDNFYHTPWNYFDARNIDEVVITKLLTFGSPGGSGTLQGLMFNNLTLDKDAHMNYGKDLSLSIAGNFTNNQGLMNINTQDGRFATLNVGQTATMKFDNMIDSATGFYKPIVRINDAQTLIKNKDHVILRAQNISYEYANKDSHTNPADATQGFKDRVALYNGNDRMDICVIRNNADIQACGRAINNSDMVNHPDKYKKLTGKAWRNTEVGKGANNKEVSVRVSNNSHLSSAISNGTKIELPKNHYAHSHYALIRPNATTHSNTTPNLVAINKHNFGTIESVFELANRSDAINVINATSGTQGRDLLQTLLIDSHNAGYARQMIDATSTGEITKQLNVATETLNNIASLEHKTNSLQTLSLSNKMVVNTRLVNLSRKHTNNIDSFAKRLQALQDKRFASVGTMAEVLYQFAPKYEKPANVWANAIGGASLSNGGNTSLYGTSAGMDTYIEGENVEAIVGGFGSYGYSSFNNQASNLNSGANNTNFGLYSRVFANKHEFDFEAQGAVGSNNENLMFKGALLQGLNQGYSYLAYSAMANANYGYDFAFLNNALVFKPSVGVSYNHLGSTNMKSNSNQVALSNGASSRHLFSANANVEARYYYGDTSFFYMNAGILQELANFGFNNAMALNSFKVNATHNPLNTHARVMIGGELQLAKEVYLNLGVIYAHNLNTMIGNIASNLGMRYSF
ncbi:vacuolating cyotoxin family protein [Helicobacter cetorum]|uniref:Vacuolating cytotoxin autotransporter n=1 Tax=Helicobacter cetorum (strain ATCC BAA-540 / CCUG 52418 / MIT 99-5656) TaxID=1163745 RepID=I0ER33_HELCM|nr:vacuolating cyotoxin family protein [Helicobacter cetorum]AFI05402.1 vacuolating cytotoxin [Helicobacter cetorum MIT 99-5656]